MYVEIKVSQELFKELSSKYAEKSNGDYYQRNPLTLKRDSIRVPRIVKMFSTECEMYTHIRCGYTQSKDGIMYTTSNGNSWGVFHSPSGEYLAFHSGARSKLGEMEGFDILQKCEVVRYDSSGPKDMHWFEDQCCYLVRKGPDNLILYVVAEIGHMPEGQEFQNINSAITIMNRRYPTFITSLETALLKGKDPELFLINSFRNKRVDVESFSPQESLAWGLVSEEVRERFLKYA